MKSVWIDKWSGSVLKYRGTAPAAARTASAERNRRGRLGDQVQIDTDKAGELRCCYIRAGELRCLYNKGG